MILKADGEFVFLGVEEKVSQRTNAPYSMITLADPVNYENYQFFKTDDLVLTNVSHGEKVKCIFKLEKRGFNNNINLVSISTK